MARKTATMMHPRDAKHALRLTRAATDKVLRSIRRVSDHAPEQAAIRYRRSALEILGPLSDVVFAVWAKHPELAPQDEPGVTYYDPDKWNMSKAEVRRAAQQLVEVETLLADLSGLIERKAGPQGRPLIRATAQARKHAEGAKRSVLRQNPEFRGPKPREVFAPRCQEGRHAAEQGVEADERRMAKAGAALAA